MGDMLTVVVPALNEEGSIGPVVERIMKAGQTLRAAGLASEIEVIVVDDGSTDRTAEIVRSYPHVHLIQHKTNRGYGAALKEPQF